VLYQAVQGGAIFTKAMIAIKYCTFANNSAMNDDGNDIFANFTTDFFGNPSNVLSDCTVSPPPQLVALTVCFIIYIYLMCFIIYVYLLCFIIYVYYLLLIISSGGL
jgi:hypothetical protein